MQNKSFRVQLPVYRQNARIWSASFTGAWLHGHNKPINRAVVKGWSVSSCHGTASRSRSSTSVPAMARVRYGPGPALSNRLVRAGPRVLYFCVRKERARRRSHGFGFGTIERATNEFWKGKITALLSAKERTHFMNYNRDKTRSEQTRLQQSLFSGSLTRTEPSKQHYAHVTFCHTS